MSLTDDRTINVKIGGRRAVDGADNVDEIRSILGGKWDPSQEGAGEPRATAGAFEHDHNSRYQNQIDKVSASHFFLKFFLIMVTGTQLTRG